MTEEPRIISAATPEYLALVRELFREYGRSLNFHICFESFEKELAALPAPYTPPQGALLLAFLQDKLAGCAALKPIGPGVGELKRLYVRPGFRGLDLGRKLSEAVIQRAREAGYQRLRLDTLPTMTAARGLYAALGFEELPKPGRTEAEPIDMELRLG